MNARTEELNSKIDLLQDAVKDGSKGLLEAFDDFKGLQNEKWWAEQGEKLEGARDATIDAFNKAGTWTKDQAQAAHAAIKTWFEDMGQKMSVAWGDFKEFAGQKFENFKEAMQQFGEDISEMWGKAMESLGKLFDEIKIGAHDAFVDVKTGMQNLCTDMSCGAANLGIAVQKGVLAMDDAFQSVKGSVSQVVADQFNKSAGQLLVESQLASQDLLNTQAKFSKMDFTGLDDKTIVSAQRHQDGVLDKMVQEQERLTAKMESRESFRDTFQGVKEGATQKMQANQNAKGDLNIKSQLNTDQNLAKKIDRSERAQNQKSSYADKVRESRSSQGNEPTR